MKKLWMVVALALLGMRAGAQAVNPQNTFGGAVSVNNPSLWLNFNDATAHFVDQVSGTTFGPTANVNAGQIVTASPSALSTGYLVVQSPALPAGLTVNKIQFQFDVTPTAGPYTIACATGTGLSLTTANSFTVNVAANTSIQTFTAPTNFTAFTVAANTHCGYWVNTAGPSVSGTYSMFTGPTGILYLAGASSLPAGTNTYTSNAGINLSMIFGGTVLSPGTVLPRQPGFDATNNANYSAAFPYNGWNAAANSSLGSYDWFTPSSMMVHVDRLNWTRSGTLVLASKGDVGSPSNSYWELYLQMNGWNSQLCYTRNSVGNSISNWGGTITQGICTSAAFDAMPNGLNYSLVITDSGTGSSGWGGTQALNMYVNGLQVGSSVGIPGASYSGTYQYGFGAVQVSVVSGGTGFTAATGFTSTGGGANCTVAGTISEAGGALTSGVLGVTYTSDYGCTSAPTVTLTSPTGTGATFSTTLNGASVVSSAPLMVPGSVSGGAFNGIAGATTTQTSTYVDEFALFPSVLSFGAISNIFYETKFYQGIVNTGTAKPVVILDDDTFVDSDNQFLLAMAIGAHKAGVITLAGLVVEDYTPAAIAAWRQMLDSAGLNDVPVTVPPVNPGASGYATTNVIAYNASTPLTLSAWAHSTAMYRSIFAKYPTRPIAVLLGGPVWGAYAAFTSSAADSVSSLTGLQLINQNGLNGGAVYAQGWLYDTSADGGTVVANNQTMPIIWVGGTPMNGGPGALYTRTASDPLWMWFNSVHTDVRQCYDCLTLQAAVSSYFTFGVSMTATGGTGYAAMTPFTLSGTGANSNCHGSGYLTASSGVLNGVEFSWGGNAVGSFSGVGSGCVTTPVVTLTGSTGTGGTISAVPTPCGKYAVAGGIPGSYSATGSCANQYMTAGSFNTNQSPISGAMMTWLINSWVDPVPIGAAKQP